MKKIIAMMVLVAAGSIHAIGSGDLEDFMRRPAQANTSESAPLTSIQSVYLKKIACDTAMQEAADLSLSRDQAAKIEALGEAYKAYKVKVDDNVRFLTVKNKDDANRWGVGGVFVGLAVYHFIFSHC